MEGGKESGSSFTSDLFGAKGSAPSAGIFDSIFAPPPPRVSGGGVSILHLSETEKKNDSASRQPTGVNAKSSVSGGEKQKWSRGNKDEKKISSSYEDYQYSSSIYYGGQDQDVYSQPKLNAGLTTFCKDVGEDDSASASRGNWWQGSLYY
ncbi:hypothetical protein MIMGU_mgv1a015692mg [Erythranthe guttata]|uniref:Uncharacterized protein n=1 Tax=Erythranthe guttata TaxID=4155 RepID=A0A022QGA5_ERYGU|nr:PREDICTED: uncharacterized protein LOC105969984 isoform X2 [Erythranthe guttata]EYU26619.1 hypothetical protein MIMGU_mgv1a015692mg [Erythranthe guttata]|eukprot:XP_012850211.1 PREDICTED: uncharacterized protein LOC105969984 isoform X2 [Erythranthe guttata]